MIAISNYSGTIGSRVYVPFRGCELEVRHLKPMFDLGQVVFSVFIQREDRFNENSSVGLNSFQRKRRRLNH
jgi:hypothetical protein